MTRLFVLGGKTILGHAVSTSLWIGAMAGDAGG